MSARDAFLRSPAATRLADGDEGRTRVVRTFTDRLGETCRLVEQRVFIGGRAVRAAGAVCRQPDGSWIFAP